VVFLRISCDGGFRSIGMGMMLGREGAVITSTAGESCALGSQLAAWLRLRM